MLHRDGGLAGFDTYQAMVSTEGIEPPYLLAPRFRLWIDLALPHLVRPLRSLTFTLAYSRSPLSHRVVGFYLGQCQRSARTHGVLSPLSRAQDMTLPHGYLPVKISQSQREAGQLPVELTGLDRKSGVRAQTEVLLANQRDVRIVEQDETQVSLTSTVRIVEERRLIRHLKDADVVRLSTPLADDLGIHGRKVKRCVRCLSGLQARREIPSD